MTGNDTDNPLEGLGRGSRVFVSLAGHFGRQSVRVRLVGAGN